MDNCRSDVQQKGLVLFQLFRELSALNKVIGKESPWTGVGINERYQLIKFMPPPSAIAMFKGTLDCL